MLRRRTDFSTLDRAMGAFHYFLFVRFPALSVAATIAAYALIILLAGRRLEISANYFVLFPVIAAAIAWGFRGGLVAGALGLPANLLLFRLIGHPEYSPASKVIAEASGLLVGSALGYLSDYYRKLHAEIERRLAIEEDLRRTLREKEVLAREVHHRVKNNLGVVKSIIALQSSRSSDPVFREESGRLTRRIQAISLVHELLYRNESLSDIEPAEYLRILASALVSAQVDAGSGLSLEIHVDVGDDRLGVDQASPLGLVATEAITNAIKYAVPRSRHPRLEVSLERQGASYVFSVQDDGPGFDPDAAPAGSLGVKLSRLLAKQLKGEAAWIRREKGTRFELAFPRPTRAP